MTYMGCARVKDCSVTKSITFPSTTGQLGILTVEGARPVFLKHRRSKRSTPEVKMTVKSNIILRELVCSVCRSHKKLVIKMLDQASNTKKAGYISYEGGKRF